MKLSVTATMACAALAVVVLLPLAASAQDLLEHPTAEPIRRIETQLLAGGCQPGWTLYRNLCYSNPPLNVDVAERYWIDKSGETFIGRGMVWGEFKRPDHVEVWKQYEASGPCAFCAKPMTWKQAAFDHKALPLWLGAIAMGVVDTEITMRAPCMKTHSCIEVNPLLGDTRLQQYSVRFAVDGLAWFGDAWLRKGNIKIRTGGWKKWWIIPLIYTGTPAGGVIANLARPRTYNGQ